MKRYGSLTKPERLERCVEARCSGRRNAWRAERHEPPVRQPPTVESSVDEATCLHSHSGEKPRPTHRIGSSGKSPFWWAAALPFGVVRPQGSPGSNQGDAAVRLRRSGRPQGVVQSRTARPAKQKEPRPAKLELSNEHATLRQARPQDHLCGRHLADHHHHARCRKSGRPFRPFSAGRHREPVLRGRLHGLAGEEPARHRLGCRHQPLGADLLPGSPARTRSPAPIHETRAAIPTQSMPATARSSASRSSCTARTKGNRSSWTTSVSARSRNRSRSRRPRSFASLGTDLVVSGTCGTWAKKLKDQLDPPGPRRSSRSRPPFRRFTRS